MNQFKACTKGQTINWNEQQSTFVCKRETAGYLFNFQPEPCIQQANQKPKARNWHQNKWRLIIVAFIAFICAY